ncbi:MAG TPA: phage portal protein [Pyrinomonadaceae bacterium]|nr:phage portal protein [Pyrinomonadaceae bacterium]HMP66619.1 phage portal protein [Pyrinomonadaceae bacterium]
MSKTMKEIIEESLHHFRAANPAYARNERYYRGKHDLAFATEKFASAFGSLFREFALNLCPAVCDAVRDKLRITGFLPRGAAATQASADVRRATSLAQDIWHRNRMPIRSAEVHREALVNGDAYAIVWPDAEGKPVIHPNRAANCFIVYDEEGRGQVVRAAKFWRTRDKRTRLNLFFPDRIERYITARPGEGTLPSADEFVPFRDTSGRDGRSGTSGKASPGFAVANPFGVVPVFHFANNADMGSFGRSELESAIPVQDGLNKSVLDMMVAMEFAAYRQRWAAGIEVQTDGEGRPDQPFKPGVDKLWLAQSPDARFGDFDTADLDQFIKVKDSFRVDIASVTGTPLYYLLPSVRSFPSGEAQRKAETRFIAKVRNRQAAFGHTWAEVMGFALRIEAGSAAPRLETEWEDPAAVSERELLENELLRRRLAPEPHNPA